MVEIGQYNQLKVSEMSQFGAFLDGGNLGDILLPNRYVSATLKPGDEIEVFIYLDSEDRLVATTQAPFAKVGEFAFLEVAALTPVGAFLDWGLPKNLLVPFREQKGRMIQGKKYLVYLYLDDATKRIVASTKIDKFTNNTSPDYETGQQVSLIIAGETDMGYRAVINHKHIGLLYKNEVFTQLKAGSQTTGYIKKVRTDDKIDLALQKPGYEAIDELAQKVLTHIRQNGGLLPLSDSSSPEEISTILGVSKKAFKKATGALYRQHLITIEPEGLREIQVKS